jgi:hypothetical protein
VVGIDVGTRKVATAFAIDVPAWTMGWGTRVALGRDGTELAVADGKKTIARIALGEQRVIDLTTGAAVALGYAPTGLLRVLR